MQSIELHQYVQAAIREEWAAFSARHPQLAAAVDESFWTNAAADSIGDDPEFYAALAKAQTLGTILEQGPAIVRDFVQRWLKRLA